MKKGGASLFSLRLLRSTIRVKQYHLPVVLPVSRYLLSSSLLFVIMFG